MVFIYPNAFFVGSNLFTYTQKNKNQIRVGGIMCGGGVGRGVKFPNNFSDCVFLFLENWKRAHKTTTKKHQRAKLPNMRII